MHLESAEVVIIGGGSTGTSIAFHLAKLGQKNVTLIEKSFLAFGSTGRSAAIVRCHYPHKETSKMAQNSLEFYENFEQLVGGPSGFTRTGFLVLVSNLDEDKLRKTIDMQKALGIDVNLLTIDQIIQSEPRLATQGIAIGAFEPRAGYADSSLVTTSLAASAERMGVKVLQKTRLTGIDTSGGKVKAIKTENGTIETDKVVCAAGIWSPEVGAMISAPFPIALRRENIVVVKRPSDFGDSHATIFDVTSDLFYRPDGQKTLLADSPAISAKSLGLSSEDFQRIYLSPDGFKEALEPEESRSFIERAVFRFPAFGNALFQGGWAGVSDFTPDGFPILDEFPGLDGFYCAFGMAGHGFKLAPAIGKAMAEFILDGNAKDIDLKEYGYNRFEQGRPIRVPLKYSGVRTV